jgi:hypothetical protein
MTYLHAMSQGAKRADFVAGNALLNIEHVCLRLESGWRVPFLGWFKESSCGKPGFQRTHVFQVILILMKFRDANGN